LGKAKDIVLRPISAQEANALVRRVHYSGKVVNNSQLHIGVFYNGILEGAMQFGPSLDKRKIQGLVQGTGWNEFIELNRMAFSDTLPRNSESRALGIAMKMLRKHAPHLKWVVSFADGTQCGDGTIYRASGFMLTGIKKNDQIWQAPDGLTAPRLVKTNLNPGSGRDKYVDKYISGGARESRTSLTDGRSKGQQAMAVSLLGASANRPGGRQLLEAAAALQGKSLSRVTVTKGGNILETGGASMRAFKEAGFKPMPGHQLRYIYFIDPTARERLTVPIIPFSEIQRRGASMYKGQPISRAGSILADATAIHAVEEGAAPIPALQHEEVA
jgi:hypothetical protein